MSLINEALRKARQAASEHDSKQPEGAFQPAKAYPSRGTGRGGGWPAVLLIAIVAAVLGAASAWWLIGDRDSAPIEVSSVPSVSAHTEPVEAASVPSPTPVRATVAPTRVPAAIRAAPIIETKKARPQEVQPGTEEPAPTPHASRPGERIYVLEAELGETTLSLGYIVSRSDNPFAEINGIDVYVGSEIEGFVVESIEADRVVLRNDDGPLELRVPD